ncbi:helix-turn-helix domain-containing protein [Oculatella sp. LEGE 06141]|uniref:helix-turn-helix domain-containing protein n=1 Tax=Oculatella sp. LEGE 06141 TaxID=1828648 RepID=UPI001882D758|nr:helix-turn-helix domain-containing protein [Oculatella sp. LEGE 06141]MBE9179567.1 helix-turn-helix domain-containing protein [Oculatella sp. LEGE 06141]
MPSALPSSTKTVRSPQNGLQPPLVSSREYGWKNILVEEFHQPPGEEIYQSATEHTLCLSLNQRSSQLSQKMGDRRHIGLFTKGDLTIAPAESLLISQWNQDDRYLRIRVRSEFLNQVAQSEVSSNCIELLPEFRARNLEIEQIGMMLLSELRNGGAAGQLYVESLTNVLAVHLLRHYSAEQPCIAGYQGGLSHYQLLQVTDYISDRLADDIQLFDLAKLVGLSQFHFSRLFKQSTGVSPYRYVLQQRVERAKQLLQTTDLPVVDIALLSGFSSHSHLGKWFRQHTGMTPKAFRIRSGDRSWL